MSKYLKYSLFVLLFLNLSTTSAQTHQEALQKWSSQKYSMFIHWGIYSQLGGVWEGEQISTGLSEQIQAHAGIYSDTYANVAKSFNPVHWNADSIVLLAKNAGMNSIVITSKHHDGFCMFDSKYTDFDVADATPYKKDVLKELSAACKRHGISFGLYFSLIDWHFPEASPISSHNSDSITPMHHEYNKKQVTELLTNYGPVSELWFDMGSQTVEQSKELRELVHRLQPNCMISSRIGNDMGDFTVMGDNQYPDYVIGVPWQSPASFYDETWGYRSWQKRAPDEEKTKEKLTSLIKVVSRGGNYLLNIGPKGDGSVVDQERNVLLKIGQWLKINEEAIYGTEADPFHSIFNWGHVTSRPNKLYLHLLSMPENGKIILPGLSGKAKKTRVLGYENIQPTSKRNGDNLEIYLPKGFNLDQGFKVLAIEFKNGYTVAPVNVIWDSNGAITLKNENAFKHYSNSGVDYNSRYKSTVKESWTVRPKENAFFVPNIYYTEEEKGKAIDLKMGEKQLTIRLSDGEAISLKNDPATVTWGTIYLNGPYRSGIEGVPGGTDPISTEQAWPGAKGKPWIKKQGWQHGKTYYLPVDMMETWYVLQEITAKKEQDILLKIGSGDGVVVQVNGQTQLVHNNPERKPIMKNTLLIHLNKGKNQLLIKLYNRFKKKSPFSIESDISQLIYRKKLVPVHLKNNEYYPFSWELHQAESIHQSLLLPNLSLQLKKK